MATSSIWAPTVLNINADIPVIIGTGKVVSGPGVVLALTDLTRADPYLSDSFNLLQYVSALFSSSGKLEEGKDYYVSGPEEITFLREVVETSLQLVVIDYKIALQYPGYRLLGNYDNGPWTFNTPEQLIEKDGQLYVPKSIEIPFTTTGEWDGVDELLFDIFSVEGKIKEELANPNGAELIGFGENNTLSDELYRMPYENHAWAGFFDCWSMGYSRAVLTTERTQIPAGVTHGRTGFAAGTAIFHAGDSIMRIQRLEGNSDTANHTACINLTAAETAPLRGKRCTAHVFVRVGQDFSGPSVTFKVQCSAEPEQPILSSVAQYTNGNVVLATNSFIPTQEFPEVPVSLTVDIPEDATNVSLVFDIRYTGTAGPSDFVEIKTMPIYIAPSYRAVRRPSRQEINSKGDTRYCSSYPYGTPFGANTTQGAVSAVSSNTNTAFALSADVRFPQRMAGPPRFQFAAPGTGVRSRWLNPDAGTFLTGLAYDLSDTGVTVTNNAAAADNTRYLFQWAAEYLF